MNNPKISEQDLYDFLGRGCRSPEVTEYIREQRHQDGSWVKAWFDKLAWRAANLDKIDWLTIALAPETPKVEKWNRFGFLVENLKFPASHRTHIRRMVYFWLLWIGICAMIVGHSYTISLLGLSLVLLLVLPSARNPSTMVIVLVITLLAVAEYRFWYWNYQTERFAVLRSRGFVNSMIAQTWGGGNVAGNAICFVFLAAFFTLTMAVISTAIVSSKFSLLKLHEGKLSRYLALRIQRLRNVLDSHSFAVPVAIAFSVIMMFVAHVVDQKPLHQLIRFVEVSSYSGETFMTTAWHPQPEAEQESRGPARFGLEAFPLGALYLRLGQVRPFTEKDVREDLKSFPKTLRRIPSNVALFLDFDGRMIDDSNIGALKSNAQVVRVGISHTSVSDDGLKVLSTLPNLRALSINSDEVTDRGLRAIGNLAVDELYLVGMPKVSEEGLLHLYELSPTRGVIDLKGNLTAAVDDLIRHWQAKASASGRSFSVHTPHSNEIPST